MERTRCDPRGLHRAGVDEYSCATALPWFPVVDAGRHFIGWWTGAADNVPAVERASSWSAMYSRETAILTIGEDEPLESVLGNEALRPVGP